MQAEVKSDLPSELLQLRDSIDEIDAEIIAALARRFAVTEQVGKVKALQRLDSVDPVREQEKLQRLRNLAEQQGMDSEFVCSLFQKIFDEVVKNHKLIRQKAESGE